MRHKDVTIPDVVLLGDDYARSLAIDWLTDQGDDASVAVATAIRDTPPHLRDVTVLLDGESIVEVSAVAPPIRAAVADHMESVGRTTEAALLRMTDIAVEADNEGNLHPLPLDFGEYADAIEYINQREYGDGQIEGEFWYADDRTLTVYGGTFGNYNSPGSDGSTFHEEYDTPEEYNARVAHLQSLPEWLEVEDEEDGDGSDDWGGEDDTDGEDAEGFPEPIY